MLAWLALWANGGNGSTSPRCHQLGNSSGTPTQAIGSIVGNTRGVKARSPGASTTHLKQTNHAADPLSRT